VIRTKSALGEGSDDEGLCNTKEEQRRVEKEMKKARKTEEKQAKEEKKRSVVNYKIAARN
jgi:hypothetical protein